MKNVKLTDRQIIEALHAIEKMLQYASDGYCGCNQEVLIRAFSKLNRALPEKKQIKSVDLRACLNEQDDYD